ncbi:hypothetical protein AWB82_03010 [Caballeronia glebae]|uniref:Uncharacterized protein n=1 Tax=Caballeronia glebae TaxID=1777143 RepID=A0A158AVI9_9BURK|nr:hypothetical protein [Caballeronia glebae]SAK61466.1 hypothetical protein AWB82_03010 [Caballeronia glebae]
MQGDPKVIQGDPGRAAGCEEEHIDWLEIQIGLVDKIEIEN